MYTEQRNFQVTFCDVSHLASVRTITVVLKDGKLVSKSLPHRATITPDTDLTAVPVAPDAVEALPDWIVAQVTAWYTVERVAAFEALVAAQLEA